MASIARIVKSRSRVVHLPPMVALRLSQVIGVLRRDVILTREEVDGLLADLLVTNSAPTGETKLSEWMAAHHEALGRRYQSELARHYQAASS